MNNEGSRVIQAFTDNEDCIDCYLFARDRAYALNPGKTEDQLLDIILENYYLIHSSHKIDDEGNIS